MTDTFQRLCPHCQRILTYTNKVHLQNAIDKNCKCRKCNRALQDTKGSYYYQLRSLGLTDTKPIYYVYLLSDSLTGKVFYVGKGKNNRMYSHAKDVEKGHLPNTHNGKLYRHIKSILDAGKDVEYEQPITNVDEITALAIEAAFIDYYGIPNLCNYQASGFGASNHTLEARQKAREGRARQLGFSSYDAYRVDKQKRQLKEDLVLLNTVIAKITKERLIKWYDSFIPLEQLGKIRTKGYYQFDRAKKIYSKLCPQCNRQLCFKYPETLYKSVRMNSQCRQCADDRKRLSYHNSLQSFAC